MLNVVIGLTMEILGTQKCLLHKRNNEDFIKFFVQKDKKRMMF